MIYVPEAFRVEEPARLLGFIDAHPFATLLTPTSGGLQVTHLPLELERADGPPRLQGHVARSNPHWEVFASAELSLAIFHGPHAYVSPAWYAKGPAAPTWNYAVVHAHGRAETIDDPARTSALLDRLVARYESTREAPWSGELPEHFRAGLERAIVAFELPIDRLEGKFKLGQNRATADRHGTVAGLEAAGDPESLALAAFMRSHLGDA